MIVLMLRAITVYENELLRGKTQWKNLNHRYDKDKGFQTKQYDSQDQEELIMMMDFKDGAQRVILLLQPSKRMKKNQLVSLFQVRQRRRELGKLDQ